jgi:septum formation protein
VSNARLILASASPRRRLLLRELCDAFDVIPCPLPEPTRRSTKVPPAQWAEALAYFKARAVADRHPDRWVLGADTIVVCGTRLLGKPSDRADASQMLIWQTEAPSDVITGVCLLRRGRESRRIAAHDVTRVWMRDDAAIRADYLDTGDWAGKAGAYGIQNVGDRLVERIAGSFSNVVGLPVELLTPILRAAGILADPAPAPANRDPGR